MFALCIFVETFITHRYEKKDVFIFENHGCCICSVIPGGLHQGDSLRGASPSCADSSPGFCMARLRRAICVVYMGCLGGMGLDLKPLYRVFL